MADQNKISSSLTQAQVDAEALYAKAAAIDPYQAALIKKNAQGNIMSPGVLTALSNLGVNTSTGVGTSMANIDAATQNARLADQKKVAQDREVKKFEDTKRGQFWTGLKGAVRGSMTVLGTTWSWLGAQGRSGIEGLAQATRSFGISSAAKPMGKTPTIKEKYIPSAFEQTVAGQVIIKSVNDVRKGQFPKIDMGSGFLPNEETGVAHAARQASLSAAKIAIRNSDGKVIGYRPVSVFGDTFANILTLGDPESQAGNVVAVVADLAGSFAFDPGIARASEIKALRKLASQQRAASAFTDAAKTEERLAELQRLEEEALTEAQALKTQADNLKKIDIESANAAIKESDAALVDKAQTKINSSISVRRAQARLDEFTSIEEQETLAVASAREARLAAEAAYKAPKSVERTENLLAKQRKQLDEMIAAREAAIGIGRTPMYSADDVAALDDAIKQTEQKLTDTKSLIETQATDEQVVKNLNPNMTNTTRVGLVKTDFLKKFAEFDRTATPKFSPEYSAETIAKITEDLKSGKGFTDRLYLEYAIDENNKLYLKLVEGNHRLQAAINAGIDEVPVTMVKVGNARDIKGYKATGFVSKLKPDDTGWLPSDSLPRDILPEEVLRTLDVIANDIVTQDAVNAAKLLEKNAAKRLKEVRGERVFMQGQVKERVRTETLMEKARKQAQIDKKRTAARGRTLTEKLNDATLSLKDKRKSWEQAVLRLANADQTLERPEFAYQNIAEFLTNGHGTKAVDKLAAMTDWKEIWRRSNQRLTAEQAKAIANAATPDEVVDVLAPYLKRGELQAGMLEPGRLSTMGETIAKRTAFAAPAARVLQGVGASVAKRMPYYEQVARISGVSVAATKKVSSNIKKLYGTKIKNGAIINIHDREELLRSVEDFGIAARLPKKVLDNLIDEIADAQSNAVAGYAASAKLLDAVFANSFEKIPAHLKASFEDYTTAFKDSAEKMSSYWATRHANGANLKYVTLRGESAVLPGPHLDSELLNSTIYLPPVGDFLKMTSRLSKYKTISSLRDVSDKVIGDWWKKTVLVRPAYIIRNIAEEQIRVAAVGHASFFTRPGQALAMWLGREEGPWVRRTLKQFDTYRNTVFGDDFSTGDEALDALDETLAHGMKSSYIDMMNSSKATSFDERDFRVLTFKNVNSVGLGHPRFFDGITNQLRILNSSEFAKVVAGYNPKFIKDAMNAGQFRQDAVVDYFLTGPGRRSLDKFAEGTPENFNAFIKTPDGLKTYLFTGKSDKGKDISVLARINETTGGNKTLQNLIAYGKVNVGGKDLFIPKPSRDAMNSIQNSKAMRAGKKQLLEEQDILSKNIKQFFSESGNWDNVLVNVPSKNVAFAEGKADKTDFFDRFFEISTTFEKNTTFGPEFRQAYWDAINSIAKTLDGSAKDRLEALAKESLTPLQKAGVNVGEKHPVWSAFKSATGNGPMTLEDAHAYADNYARMHVKELFYNAHERRLLFHQLRLVAPFANAWENTVAKWLELGTENPLGVYKAVKSLEWLNSPESSALYQMTDAEDYYDPNQGFFFTDPQSGQRQFFVPFAGTVMASLAKGITGVDYKGAPMAFSSNPMSFNFAFGQGTMLPGIGPGITLPLSALGTFNGNFIDAMPLGVQKWLFPFGRANFSGGLQTAILPGNWNRIIGGLTGMEQTYSSNFKPVMNYLASGANYNLDNPEDQARLVQDTDTFARWESVMRGVIGLVSPMGLIQQGIAKDKDGDLTLQAALYNDFQTLYQKNDGDYNRTWFDFLNLYGASNAFAIISSSAGNGPSNWDSYAFVVKNPDVATKYSDVWGYVMPGGGLSTEMYQWNVAHDTKVKLSPTQLLQKVNNQRFYAARDALLTQVDAGTMDRKSYSTALQNLKDIMGGGPVVEFDPNKRDRVLGQLNELVADDRFADIPSITALRDYMYVRQAVLAKIGKKKFTGSQVEQGARDYLAAQAEWIIQDNPDFQKMFYAFFANELEGK